ncbi:MAG: hypothetical protein ACYS6I_07105 [Planctomycetota bacterium]|jgi:hypothetical protein
MLPKALVLIVLIVIIGLGPGGCKKSSPESSSGEDIVKTAAEYAEEAEREINTSNMADELKKIEDALDAEETQEP